jgi:DNA-directed RNA polymerase specialized sigma24 family protein
MKYSQSFNQYVVDFAAAVESRVQYLRFLSDEDKEDVAQSIIEWVVLHPEKAEQFPPDELATMNVKFRAIDWKRRNARQANETARNPETGVFVPNKRMSQMTNPGELEAAMSHQCYEDLSDVEGKVLEEMNREHLEAKLKDNLTDLQWNVLYKRTVGDMSNNEISEEMKSPHYNISRAYKAAVINAKEYLEIEMRKEDQDQNLSGVINLEEVSRYESKLDTSNNQQFVVAS